MLEGTETGAAAMQIGLEVPQNNRQRATVPPEEPESAPTDTHICVHSALSQCQDVGLADMLFSAKLGKEG